MEIDMLTLKIIRLMLKKFNVMSWRNKMSWKSIKNNKNIILFLGIFALLIVASYFLTKPGPEEYPAFRVDSPAPDGTKAFYQSLREFNYPVEMFYEHSSQLEASSDTALFLFNPPLMMDSSLISGYQEFIEQGGTIYLFRDRPTELSNVSSFPLILGEEETEVSIGEQRFQAEPFSSLRFNPDSTDHVLVEDDYGVVAYERVIGEGSMIDFAEPSWLTNELILAHDHLHIINETFDFSAYDLLLFESYHYLDETGLTVLDVTPNPLIVFAIVVLLASILLIWLKGKRFGPALSLREQTVRFGDERIRALANWQLKGRNFHEALQVEVEYLKYVIFERTGTPITADWSGYNSTLTRLLPHRKSETIDQLINDLQVVLESEQITKKEFLTWTKRIDHIRREVEAE